MQLQTGIPINVREFGGLNRSADPVTFAIPLAAKKGIKSVEDLIVLNPARRKRWGMDSVASTGGSRMKEKAPLWYAAGGRG